MASTGKHFFGHSLDPIPDTEPPYYVDLVERHAASIDVHEATQVVKDYVAFSRECYQAHLQLPAGHFQHNDAIQGLLDLPLAQFGASDGWERRKAQLRALTSAVSQRGVTVCAAHLRHALVHAAAGFVRHGHEGGTYTVTAEGLLLRTWRSAAEARRYVAALRATWQAIFELQLRTLRCPVAVMYMYRGILFTVTAAVPLLPLSDALPDPTRGAVLSHELDILRHALKVNGILPNATFGVERGGDGRYYVLDIDAVAPLQLDPPALDTSRRVRTEALKHLPVSVLSGPDPPGGVYLREMIVAALVPQSVVALLDSVRERGAVLASCIKDQVCCRALHATGLNLQFLFAVYEEAFEQESAPTLGYEAAEMNCALEAIEVEMVCRTVKEMMRCELRASPGEDDATHCQRVNRLLANLANKRAGMWEKQLLPLLRLKFGAPAHFTVKITSGLIKILAGYVSQRLGVAFDKGQSRFSGFAGVPQASCLFAPPEELLQTIAAPPPGASASSPLSPTQQLRRIDSALPSESAAEAGMGRSGEPSALTRKDTMAVLRAPSAEEASSAKESVAARLDAEWKQLMARRTNADHDHHDQSADALHRTDPRRLCRVYRILALARMLQLPSFDRYRAAFLTIHFDSYPFQEIAEEAKRRPPVPPQQLLEAVVQVRLLALGDRMRPVERERFLTLLEILTNNRLNDEDGIVIGRWLAQAGGVGIPSGGSSAVSPTTATSVAGADPHLLARAARHMRVATWLDLGLVNEFFASNIAAATQLNVLGHTKELREVLRSIARTVSRHNATARRARAVAAYRRASSALVASQDVEACAALKEACRDSFSVHSERFGPRDPQTGVAHAHFVFVYATAFRDQLSFAHQKELKKLNYYVSTMGTSTMEALKQLLASEAYRNTTSSVIMALQAVGESTMAERAMTHLLALGGPASAMVLRTHDAVQGGAAGKLARLLRAVITGDKEREIRKLACMDHAYRMGIDHEEETARQRLARAGMEVLFRGTRKTLQRVEAAEREKLIDAIWRFRYEARREERIREKEEAIARQQEAKRREAAEAAERLASKHDKVSLTRTASRVVQQRARSEDGNEEDEEHEKEAAALAQREELRRMEERREACDVLLCEEEAAREGVVQVESEARAVLAGKARDAHVEAIEAEAATRNLALRTLHGRAVMGALELQRREAATTTALQTLRLLTSLSAVQVAEIEGRAKLARVEGRTMNKLGAAAAQAVAALALEDSRRRLSRVGQAAMSVSVLAAAHQPDRAQLLVQLHQRLALSLQEEVARRCIIGDRNFEISFLFAAAEIQLDEIKTREQFYDLQFSLWTKHETEFQAEIARLLHAQRQLALDEAKRRREIEEEERAAREKLFMFFLQERMRIEAVDILRRKNREQREAHRLAMLREQEKRRALLQAKREAAHDGAAERNALELLRKMQQEQDREERGRRRDALFASERERDDPRTAVAEARQESAAQTKAELAADLAAARAAEVRAIEERRARHAEEVQERRDARAEAQRVERERHAARLRELQLHAGGAPVRRKPLYVSHTDDSKRRLRAERAVEKEDRARMRQEAVEARRIAAGRKRDLIAACLFLNQREEELTHDEQRAAREERLRQVKAEQDEEAAKFSATRQHKAQEKKMAAQLAAQTKEEQTTHRRERIASRRDAAEEHRTKEAKASSTSRHSRAQQASFDAALRRLEAAKREAYEWDILCEERAEVQFLRRMHNQCEMNLVKRRMAGDVAKRLEESECLVTRLTSTVSAVDELRCAGEVLREVHPVLQHDSPLRHRARPRPPVYSHIETSSPPPIPKGVTTRPIKADVEPPVLPPLGLSH